MKKLDKLVLQSFAGPLILTFFVIIFILLSRQMLYYFDEIIGKDLGITVVLQFLFYFAIVMLPAAMPLSVLLASLITFGNLAEHFELTAVKAGGISPLRVLRPICFVALLLSAIAFYVNNNLVPYASLEAYTLLYDIRQKKPALDISEGVFYNGIPGISIKVNRKFPNDDAALKEIILYNHHDNDGNNEVLVADSGRMSTILNEQYLRLEFFNGYQYTENKRHTDQNLLKSQNNETLSRQVFAKSEMVFDLSSFDLSRSDKSIFEGNRMMRNISELQSDIDTIEIRIRNAQRQVNRIKLLGPGLESKRTFDAGAISSVNRVADSLVTVKATYATIQNATNAARTAKAQLQERNSHLDYLKHEQTLYKLQWHKIPATALGCFIMFLIGAPLGVIIRRGGLGIPFLISIFFFILFTLLTMNGEKLAKQFYISAFTGAWIADFLMFITGCFLLRIAYTDARFYETDFFRITHGIFRKLFSGK